MLSIGSEAGRDLYRVAEETGNRLQSRAVLESAGLVLFPVPIGGIDGIDDIKQYWIDAVNGYRLCFRMGQAGAEGINPLALMQETTPDETLQLAERLQQERFIRRMTGQKDGPPDESVWKDVEATDVRPTLLAFGHVLATLTHLRGMDRVSLYDIDTEDVREVPDALADARTFWRQFPYDAQGICTQMIVLARGTHEALYTRDRVVGTEPFLRAWHFFAASEQLNEMFRTQVPSVFANAWDS